MIRLTKSCTALTLQRYINQVRRRTAIASLPSLLLQDLFGAAPLDGSYTNSCRSTVKLVVSQERKVHFSKSPTDLRLCGLKEGCR